MNLLTFVCLIALCIVLSKLKIQVKKIPINEAPESIKTAWLKRHPAVAWKLHLSQAMIEYVDDFNKNLEWWKEHSKDVKRLEDMSSLVRIKSTVSKNLEDSGNKLKKMSCLKIWWNLKVLKVKPDELVRKNFGKNIKQLYLCSFLLREGKKNLEKQTDFLDDDIITAWVRGLAMPRQKLIFSNELFAEASKYAESIVYPKGNKSDIKRPD